MPKAWPVKEFNEYLRALMAVAGIPNFAELSRLTGVSENQFSTWHHGKNQPSQPNLRKIAPVLGVPPVNLFLAAGINVAEELELNHVDLRVIPKSLRELIDLYADPRLTAEHRAYIDRSAAHLVAGLLAEVEPPPPSPPARGRPNTRRRAG
jgi:transcriptional regulator with XRE-family HTH domain